MVTKESDILATIMDGLAAKRIWRKRMNSGAVVSSYKGKSRMIRFGEPGMADIMAWLRDDHGFVQLLWLEIKNEKGKQSEAQVAFMQDVRIEGHHYFVARSWEDVCNYLQKEFGR